MSELCRCERCARIVAREKSTLVRKALYGAMWIALFPYAMFLFFGGPIAFAMFPLVTAMGLGISAGFGEWAFPHPVCPYCRATLERAPVVHEIAQQPIPAGGRILAVR